MALEEKSPEKQFIFNPCIVCKEEAWCCKQFPRTDNGQSPMENIVCESEI